MKITPKETYLCIVSGLLISVIILYVLYKMGGPIADVAVPIGLVPMTLIVGIRLGINDRKK